MTRKDYLYQHYTWPELGQAAKRQPVVVLPIGSVEDHGPHLPLDVDNFLIWSICEAAAQQAEGGILLMPIVPFGYETHHMDFPGTIDIQIQHLLDFVLDVTKSVAHHGFRRILIADGHGSNMSILDLVARRTILETEALCAPFLWPSLALKEIRQVRESARGGMSHACELETSVYLYPDAERVQMDKARKETAQPPSDFIWNDLTDPGPIRMMDYWTRFSKSGVNGDPTLATREKGRIIFEAVVINFVRLARDLRTARAVSGWTITRPSGRAETMKITDVEAIHLRLPQVDAIADGTQDVLIIRIHTDAGLVGIGEVSSQSYVCKAIFEAPRSAERRHGLACLLRGQDPFNVEALWQRLYRHTNRYGRRGAVIHAISGADLALWDLCGKAAGKPVYELLVDGRRGRIRAYASYLFGATPAETGELARQAVDLGLRHEVRLGAIRPEPGSGSRARGGRPPIRRAFARCDG